MAGFNKRKRRHSHLNQLNKTSPSIGGRFSTFLCFRALRHLFNLKTSPSCRRHEIASPRLRYRFIFLATSHLWQLSHISRGTDARFQFSACNIPTRRRHRPTRRADTPASRKVRSAQPSGSGIGTWKRGTMPSAIAHHSFKTKLESVNHTLFCLWVWLSRNRSSAIPHLLLSQFQLDVHCTNWGLQL